MPPSLPSPLSAADYEVIESAVMETARGRWFLAEYARRNRHADTEMLLTAMDRLENAVRGESFASIDRVRAGLVDMAEAIARAKADIAALKPEGAPGHIEEATEELDAVVGATQAATSEILGAAEQIQELAWTLREQGLESAYCDTLDARATDIYTACSFQDITGQRTRKVIQVMRYLEGRLSAMIDLWGRADDTAGEGAVSEERALLNGPAMPGQGLDQSDVDRMMDPKPAAPAEAGMPELAADAPRAAEIEIASESEIEPVAVAPPLTVLASVPDVEWEEDVVAEPCDEDELPAHSGGMLAALSAEEKIALFT
ncbi:MAG: protein phosphatase CheZ [Variibacter sp.]|nr:protein phosphatase CheZ [Variibacter sp.]